MKDCELIEIINNNDSTELEIRQAFIENIKHELIIQLTDNRSNSVAESIYKYAYQDGHANGWLDVYNCTEYYIDLANDILNIEDK